MTDPLRSGKLQPWHVRRKAVVYVRQSTPQQVAEHQESTARQYALADRAIALGWPAEDVVVIDDDLGTSGRSAEGRPGFQRLLAEVALDHVGLILGLEMSRLARSCKDWHHLLELCGCFRTLLADADALYDPTDDNDRLLLGLTGIMSEAELPILKERMYQGKLNKARRGELANRPAIGYVRTPSGELAIDPDEQVQAVVRLIFDQFDRQGTSHGVLRHLAHHHIRMPVRPHAGANRGQLEWRRPNRGTLQDLLRHPVYAGAYRFGHRPTDPRRKRPGRPATGKQVRRPEECLVLIRDRLPADISWERFQAKQERLAANRARHSSAGAPRRGASLRGGLVSCGRCGRRMTIRYSGRAKRHWYACTHGCAVYADPPCQSLSGPILDELVAHQILQAVEPAALEASLAAVAEVERERAELHRHWQLRRERARYEAERAAQQYHTCEPENRLVGRELERRWEEALRQQRQVEEEFERWQGAAPVRLAAEDREAIRALAADLPAVWRSGTTTAADRQRIARLLLERVVVTVDRSSEHVDVELRWAGGPVRHQALKRPVRRYEDQAEFSRLVARLREWIGARHSAAEIAARLNAEGFRPPKRAGRFTGEMVRRLSARLGLAGRRRAGSRQGLGPDEWRPGGLARHLDVSRDTVRYGVRAGWVHSRRDNDGQGIIWANADEIARLRELYDLPRVWENKARRAELIRPKPRPGRSR
jgi:DNA invertase Pin-like site-specific DNA recombinase